MFAVLLPRGPMSPEWRAVVRRLADLLVVYGHGLLAFGVSKLFTGTADTGMALALAFGVACHAAACYMSYALEVGRGP